MRYLTLLAFLALPAMAYGPEELLADRDDVFNCPEGAEVCTIKRKDAEWVIARDQYIQSVAKIAIRQAKQCNPRGI